jgi:predicted RecA/RadA family phage recombinase
LATNFIQNGKVLTVTAAADVASGDVAIVGGLAGIALGAAATGDKLDVALEGVFSIAKVATDVLAVGVAIYWDAAASLATGDNDSGANPLLGHAFEAAGNPSATVAVRLAN